MNENEMLNPTAVETNEAAVAAVPEENVNAAPVSEPQEAKEATEAAPADEGVDEEVNEVPRATRRFNDDDLAIGAFIDDGNDMLHVDMPEDRRARDLAEMRRCVADNKHGPRRFLQGKVFGVRPVQNGSAVVEVSRGTLRVMIPAEDFFYFSLMKGIEENDATTRQRRYLRKAKLMNGAIINFCPYMEAKSEDGEVVFAGSRQDAMQLQRNRHFFGRNADVQNGSRAIASILSSGPDYVIAEALGVETTDTDIQAPQIDDVVFDDETEVLDVDEDLDDLSVDIQDTQSAQPAKQGRGQVVNSDDDVSLDDVDLFDDSTVSRTEERPQNVKTSGKTMGSQKQPQTTQNNSDIDYMSLNDISIFDSEE